jgi:hypothetical protein
MAESLGRPPFAAPSRRPDGYLIRRGGATPLFFRFEAASLLTRLGPSRINRAPTEIADPTKTTKNIACEE